MFRLQILPLVLLLGTAPTAQAICRADCVGTVPRARATAVCHDGAGAALAAVPEEACSPSLDDAILPATLRESSGAPAASPALPVGTPALVFPGARVATGADLAWRRASDRRPLVTALRI